MEYTNNYQLPIWAETDRILMEDFNDSYQKLEDALTEHGESLAGKGDCQIYTTSYVGTGTYGSNNQISITCPNPPVVVLVYSNNGIALAVNPTGVSGGMAGAASGSPTFLWSGKTVSWFGSDISRHMNIANVTYYVTALLRVE